MYFTYVLQSQKDNRNYSGYTKDLDLRMKQHQQGEVQEHLTRSLQTSDYKEAKKPADIENAKIRLAFDKAEATLVAMQDELLPNGWTVLAPF